MKRYMKKLRIINGNMKCTILFFMLLISSISYAQEAEVKVAYNKNNYTLSISIHNPTTNVINLKNGEDSAIGYDVHYTIKDAKGNVVFGKYCALENSKRNSITIQPKDTNKQELNVSNDFQIDKELEGYKIVFSFNLFYKSDKPRRFQKKYTYNLN